MLRKLCLVEAKARALLSLAAAAFFILVVIVIDSTTPYGRWQEETISYQEWISGDRPQICKQLYDEQSAQCDSASIAKPDTGDSYDRMFAKEACLTSPENRLALSRLECIPHKPNFGSDGYVYYGPNDPGSLTEFTWSQIKKSLPEILPTFFAMAAIAFIFLTAGRLFLTETHVGWRRISLVIGALGSVFTLIAVLLSVDRFSLDSEILVLGAIALSAFPLSVLLVLGGWRISGWIFVGFRQGHQATETVQSTAELVAPSIIDSSVPIDPIVARTLDQGLNTPLEEKKLSSGYLVRHWRGELSLPVSYWINGNILVGIMSVALLATVNGMENGNYSLRAISFASLGILLFSIMAWLWSIVGIWRSADHHVARGGMSAWATMAKFMVVVGIIAMAGKLTTNILPQVKELTLIAIGNDPIGDIVIKVSANGQSVIVIGTLREGSAAEVQKILDAAPGATSLVLSSNGGRLFEAQQLARAVRNRNLDTYVKDQCISACTYVFLAGRDRAAAPNARIGFHQPSFPGLDTNTQRSMTQDMMDVYRSAGLPEAFLQRIVKTSPEDMWYPTREELIDSNVITRMSLGGE